MKCLYVSDLDGTLLRSDERTSEYTNRVINSLTERGIAFSYATARSLITAKKVTQGIEAKIPLIVYNGAFVIDNLTEEILLSSYFDKSVNELLEDLFSNNVYPIVYAHIDGTERFSFVPELCTEGMKKFLQSRAGDVRTNAVSSAESLKRGSVFYITCIDKPEVLKPLYVKYKQRYHCVYQTDIYSGEQWLEIMPQSASKASAARRLQELLGCDRLIAFGDGKNDIDMFEAADECYAVANADEALKEIATGIIPCNNEDGVARWLEEFCR